MNFLGLGKTLFNSSAALLTTVGSEHDYEVVLTERLTRNKYSGAWPEKPISYFLTNISGLQIDSISENSDVVTPKTKEDSFNKIFPFYESISKKKLERFTQNFNPNLIFYSHHEAHAYSAMSTSPFENCLILVIDGGGSRLEDLPGTFVDIPNGSNEFLSLYQFNNGDLSLVDKKFQQYKSSRPIKGKSFGNGVGAFYESISEFIFKDKFSSGKVMGLAPFGTGEVVKPDSYIDFLNNLNWDHSYIGTTKEDWENSKHLELYKELAATAQASFEDFILGYLIEVKAKFPDLKNIIFTGGCALNCTLNWKIIQNQIFEDVYIPVAPNDSGISLGCAYKCAIESKALIWKKTSLFEQDPYKGPKASIPEKYNIRDLFKNYKINEVADIALHSALLLEQGNVIAWFQGRSEFGPRALGNRSILASVKVRELKNYLNNNIKFREEFRPYACSVMEEDAAKLFHFPDNFKNPFMSFAVPIKEGSIGLLKEVAHVDNTNRMQMVNKELNPLFHELLTQIKELQSYGVLLNTSLNVMGEPIVETPEDLLRFFEKSEIKTVVIGNFIIEK